MYVFMFVPKLIIFFNLSSTKKILEDMKKSTKHHDRIKVSPEKIVIHLRKIIFMVTFSKNCFLRSYVSYKVLERFGFHPQFFIGLNVKSEFKSHAWLQINNTPLCENLSDIEKMNILYNH